MPASRLQMLSDDLILLAANYDKVIVDLGGGVERTVRQLTHSVGACLVVATDEPTSLTDAYAFIKITHMDRPETDIRIVVNMVKSDREGERTYNTLLKACEGFLKISPPLLGVIRRDPKVREAIRSQTSILTRFPNSEAASDVEAIAGKLLT
jgi:flagellar biosynthesis protein FlhG